jgi:peptide/nickel transport system ATP-binding protein
MSVLEVRNLTVEFAQRDGSRLRAVDNVSFELRAGETLALVGESGSGKSTVARALSQLLTPSGGQVMLRGQPAGQRGRALRRYRSDVQMVFQDPFASLNPSFPVEHHIRRPLRISGHPRAGLDQKIDQLLEAVNLAPPRVMAGKYPHELSGGQRQRVAIARALAPEPAVMLADEPVSMLDVSIRLEIMNLLDALKRDRNLALLYITHDLATARHFSARIMVMYRGEIVEQGPVDEVILNPAHPYTQLLESAVPHAAADRAQVAAQRHERLRQRKAASAASAAEGGEIAANTGCRFRARCPHAMEICATPPPDFDVQSGHTARCWLHNRAPSAAPAAEDLASPHVRELSAEPAFLQAISKEKN